MRALLRSIATRWVLLVLAAVVVPLLGFAYFMRAQLAERHWASVEYYLLTMAQEMADRLDTLVAERVADIQSWDSMNPLTEWALGAWDEAESPFPGQLQGQFDRFVERGQVYDLVIAVDANGRLLAASSRRPGGGALPPMVVEGLQRSYANDAWFLNALQGQVTLVDHHRSALLEGMQASDASVPEMHLGIAVPVKRQLGADVVGVVYALMNWRHVQTVILKPVKPRIPLRMGSDLYGSTYAWLWKSDCDTILAHPSKELYMQAVSRPPIELPQLVEAAKSSEHGLYPMYEFRGVGKSAAYKHCRSVAEGGFGWVVGVGMDNQDITATLDELQSVLLKATIVVVLLVVLGTAIVARRTTAPILRLQQATRRVAAGDLTARSGVTSADELGDLGRAFDEMTKEIDESRRQLVKAEKERAWREMARQVAHEIKNPLTPIQLSVNLLKRARDEGSPEYPVIFERTVELVLRQVDNMKRIASDFAAFAGARASRPERLDVSALYAEVLDLNAAWASEAKVEVRRALCTAFVRADAHELRRVLINLVSNAIEAMPQGGVLEASITLTTGKDGRLMVLELRDTGVGLSETARSRLFEPYFTTRTHGTGLGLAIARRLVEEMNGTIELEPRKDLDRGTVARIQLPLLPATTESA